MKIEEAIKVLNIMKKDIAVGGYPHYYDKQKRIGAIDAVMNEIGGNSADWVEKEGFRGKYMCSKCGSYAPRYESGVKWLSFYCPTCGAKMNVVKIGEDDDIDWGERGK